MLDRENKIKISIITVVYNDLRSFAKTIANIKELHYRNIQYIVVDGGSSDGTVKEIKKNSNAIDYWISEPDQGLYDAMNKGIDVAIGDWIIFMNAGDTFVSSTVLDTMSKCLDEDKDVVYGDRYYKSESEGRIYQTAKDIKTIYERMPFGHQSVFVKSSILKKEKFNTSYKYAADYEFFIRLYKLGYRFFKVNVPVCVFEAGGKSESGLRPHLEVIKILLDNCTDRNIIRKNAYLRSFRKSCISMIDKYLE